MAKSHPKVLQVYALTGLGHLREATAIKNALDEAGIVNDTLDILKWAEIYSWYTRIAVIPLKLFKWFFEVTTRNTSSFNSFQPPSFLLRAFLELIRLFEVPLGFALRSYLKTTDYDIFLAVHPWGLGALWSFGRGKVLSQKLINVIPDEIDTGSASFYGIPGGINGPLHMVNSLRVKRLFELVGVNPERIVVIGHTLDPLVLKERSATYSRIQGNLKHNKKLTLGVLVGGTGTVDEKKRIKNMISELAPHIKNGLYKLIIVAGPHLEFAEELSRLADSLKLDRAKEVEIYSSINRGQVVKVGHEHMVNDFDVLFAKTGEIIFYTMATGLPHLHLPPKGSNEVEHVELMQSLNAIFEYDRITDLHEFLQNRQFLLELSKNAYHAGYKLDGAVTLAEYILQHLKND